MFAKLSALVGSAPVFPYTTGQAFGIAWGCWTHFQGTKKEDLSEVSIFRISAQNKDDQKLQSARNGVKRLKLVLCFTLCCKPIWYCKAKYTSSYASKSYQLAV